MKMTRTFQLMQTHLCRHWCSDQTDYNKVLIGHFRVAQASVSRRDLVRTIDMKMIPYSRAKKPHFHKKGFARSLVLKVRGFGTRKWLITPCLSSNFCFSSINEESCVSNSSNTNLCSFFISRTLSFNVWFSCWESSSCDCIAFLSSSFLLHSS